MNRTTIAREDVRRQFLPLLLLSFLAVPAVGSAESAPGELKLFLAPGSGRQEVIVFSPKSGGAMRREVVAAAEESGEVPDTAAAAPPATQRSPAQKEQAVVAERREERANALREERKSEAIAASDGPDEQPATTPLPLEPSDPMLSAPKPAAEMVVPADPYLYRPSLSLGYGQRIDNLNWTISDIDGSPNILSELDWRDVASNTFTTELRYSDASHFYFRGNFQVGVMYDGSVRDSDYYGDDRTMEFSRSKADTEDGSLYDLSGAIGYRLDIPSGRSPVRLHLMPLVGYTYNAQEFDITHGRQIISAYGFGLEEGKFSGLHSSYDSLWKGPWLGFDLELRLGDRHTLTGSFAHYWFDYEGQANWNLRDDFAHPVSFRHDADGEGTRFSLGYRLNFHKDWFVTLNFSRVEISTDRGHDTTYFADGSELDVPFNGASWDSTSWVLGVGYNF